MKIPSRLEPLIEEGIIDEVVRQLKSGKEASVFVVRSGANLRCAKVYKEANQRGFHKLAEYREGRKARGSRDERAMKRRGQHGRQVLEAEWKNAEVEALYTLANAGVRVPTPYGVYSGVLLMELILGSDGLPAPRLSEVEIEPETALQWHAFLIGEIVRMLCAGLVHGDLSPYNILITEAGPVIIDLPQAASASANANSFRLLERDVNNMRETFGRVVPELLSTEYAREIWSLYEAGTLTVDTALTGTFVVEEREADVGAVLAQIDEARREAEARQRGREEAERNAD